MPPDTRSRAASAPAAPTAPTAPAASAAPGSNHAPLAAFPALAQLLGADCFGRLAVAAVARAEALQLEPGAVVHGLLLQRDVPLPARVCSRLAADVAALERAIEEVARLAPACRDEPRLGADALIALDATGELGAAACDRAILVPLRALRLVPVAFRLESYVRRAHRGGRPPPSPRRDEQHIVVYALPGCGDLSPAAWWQGLPPGEGRLLAALALGTPIGLATRDAITRGAVADEAAAHAIISTWLRDGLFTRLHRDD